MSNLYSYYIQVIFISFIVVNHLTEIYLTRRQLEMYQKHAETPPQEFAEFLSESDHQKAIQYSSAKLRLAQLRLLFDGCLMLYWFPMRGAEKLYLSMPLETCTGKSSSWFHFTCSSLHSSLPWSVYSTFVLEEKFGFNKSTPKLFAHGPGEGILFSEP